MSDNTPAVHFERRGTTAVITLDSPAERNALTAPVKDGLAQAVARVKADSGIRAVVITGANGAFCAGGDLRGIAAAGKLESDGLRSRTVLSCAMRQIRPRFTGRASSFRRM